MLAGRELLGRSSCDPLRSSPSEEERRWEGLRQLLGCGGAGNARNEPLQCTAHFLTENQIVPAVSGACALDAQTNLSGCMLLQASEAAVLNFFETLRVELRDEVGITIATSGWIVSEMTGGKQLSKEGTVEVDP